MKHQTLFLICAICVICGFFAGCGTEARKAITVDNGKGVTLQYSSADGGNQSSAEGRDVDLIVDADGNIKLSYKSDKEQQQTETNDPAAITEAAGNAAEGVISGGLIDALTGP